MSTQNPSLQKKSAARTAAVQCLYQQAITGDAHGAQARVAALKNQLKDNRGEQKLLVGLALEPNYKLMESLLSGVAENLAEIDLRLEGALSGDWKRSRMSPLLIAILQCAICELFFLKEINPAIAIDEYTRLTRNFLTDAEADFVHAALHTLAKQYG